MMTIEPPSTSSIPDTALFRMNTAQCLRHACLLLAVSACAVRAVRAQTAPAIVPEWHLVWSDEFNGPAGKLPDPAKWTFDLGGGGNGNHELETYTNSIGNVQQRDGLLVITAVKEDHTGADGISRSYTSARIKTQGLFAQKYGRLEARIQMPLGKGIWPAFWMLGNDIDTVHWPQCGEVDIVENIGEAGVSHSTLHGPGYNGSKAITAEYALPAGEAVNSAFHLYAVEWAPNDIKFFLDDHLVTERTPANLPAGTKWVYDHPFFLILNLAVGGDWPGNPDGTTTFPQQMLVDYVRVYTQKIPTTQKTPTASRKP